MGHEKCPRLGGLLWEFDVTATMTRVAEKSDLERFTRGTIDFWTLSDGANMIEGRKDVFFEDFCCDHLVELIF